MLAFRASSSPGRRVTVKKRERDEITESAKRARIATKEVETDPRRLAWRRKEVSYGKNTLGYDRYARLVAKADRKKGDPQTPDITRKASKRQFEGLLRAWRRKLHEWDPPEHKNSQPLVEPLVEPVVVKPEDSAPAHVCPQVEDDGLGPDVFCLAAPEAPTVDPIILPKKLPVVDDQEEEATPGSSDDVLSDDDLL
ncbi:hypothetical protein CTAYLR_005594 [Chrysophaeum taylorii]|uniref:Histone RNA hairpin-binding protein RNA-binding domain-containing protein n=1 Tax=Chrysophaeum taylorii TaxID=2483200 RepID=A0AAD7U7U1_9STRA|nr:hypothetical protein CTAYLR_005594 [Chrysophaeum taylorii]